ncbi:SiaB family protein kinase [Holophaga foetida]|uniref:SiaB family protein kinase n=1 Tax=Holophaga foetida TaxID=35839 RepID=UPI0002472A8A|nr:SiaB family protein kinase [Holophaga foetida]
MLAANHYRMKTENNQQGTIFSFNGFISEGILFALGDALKKKLSIEETDVSTMKRVFSVFVEQAQNIIRYSAETLVQDGQEANRISSGLLSVGNENGRFFVICGNVMNRENASPLQQRLEKIRNLDQAGIKAYYMERIRDPEESSSKGANLGLIEIARRSSEPIQFDFLDIDESTTFYCMKAFI